MIRSRDGDEGSLGVEDGCFPFIDMDVVPLTLLT